MGAVRRMGMIQTERHLAGLRTLIIGDLSSADQIVLLLHGYAMLPEDLAPFAHALQAGRAAYVLPQSNLPAPSGGGAWWRIDEAAKQRQLMQGPRDLAESEPEGLPAARLGIERLLAELFALAPGARLVLGGFSQGGMLACDVALHTATPLDALFLLSASMLTISRWRPLLTRLSARPVLVAHGRGDDNLALAAGERLRDALTAAGAQVRWVPFDGGHQIPPTVWRHLRRFLGERAAVDAHLRTPAKPS